MSDDKHDFLAEIGTEELPPRALPKLSAVFAQGVRTGLKEAGLKHGDVTPYATPRRLAVLVHELQSRQADRKVDLRGPPVKIAFDKDGSPTKAALAFAGKCGVSVDELQKTETDKGSWLTYSGIETGQPASALLTDIVGTALNKLPIPKRMRWGAHESEFVRPVHWVVMLLGNDVIPATLFEIDSDRQTYGHRFHSPGAIALKTPADYATALAKQGYVIADFAERRQMIRTAIDAAASKAGGVVVTDEALVDEVTSLVEWPVAVSARFDERFLSLPEEVLIETLQAHQRYFPVRGKSKLLPVFITVSNIDSRDISQVCAGNERVVGPRLADAAFFWDSDRRTALADRVTDLESVVFQKKLGTLRDKTTRVGKLSVELANAIGADGTMARRAALLAKCDLLTEMVGEFPSLQGTMGRYYADHDGEAPEVAQALEEQYLPRFAGDALPATETGSVLSIAEKLDTIAGIFSIGQRPTGTRDPFGLRRSALGVLRMLIEKERDVDLNAVIKTAIDLQPVKAAANDKEVSLADDIYDYLLERLRAYYLDDTDAGFSSQMFDAVAARRPDSPLDFHQRLLAVREFAGLEAAQALAAANKRIANILRSADGAIPDQAQAEALVEDAEKVLFNDIQAMQKELTPLLAQRDYTGALNRLSTLRPAVDRFFDDVMVMADDMTLRSNRLALLRQLRRLFLHTADLSRLQVG